MSEPNPERPPAELDYARSTAPNVGRLLMGIFGGVFGYLGLMVVMYGVCALSLPSQVSIWALFAGMTLVPLGLMLLVARWLKSRAMTVSVWITFGVMALSCGTCAALFSA